jgi:sulfopyruvate decarboxylase alpha subunit
MTARPINRPTWVEPTHRALIDGGVSIVGTVPDGGLRYLLHDLDGDDRVTLVRLTTEEEGVALAAGAWLGGARAALLMQSSGVGNCINMLSVLQTCAIPALLVVTMRGQNGEANPWQLPMGSAAGAALELMGVDVRPVTEAEDVAPAVAGAIGRSFERGCRASAVLIAQSIVGVKTFTEDQP